MPATDQFWRKLPTMHRVFALSAVVLLGSTLLMMYVDESREWKDIQRRAEDFRVERLDQELAEFQEEEYQRQVAEVQAQIEEAEAEIKERSDEIAGLRRDLTDLEGRVQLLNRLSRTANAERDKARADYDIAVRDEVPADRLARVFAVFEEKRQKAVERALEFERVKTEFDELKSELDAKLARRTDAESELSKLQSREEVLREQRDLLRPETPWIAFKRWTKEWPIINGFNPHLKIQYDWPQDQEQILGMTKVSRIDRCRTCHVNAADFGAGNVPNYPQGEYEEPFCSHPNGDLYLTATSPHPITQFGCTVCHEGDGSGTSFQNAEHSPPDPATAKQWEKEFGWHENHFWEYPMWPKQFVEASCLKCHHNVVELGVNEEFGETAPKLYKGYSLIRDYGCFGCHEINGFDGATPIGPDMRLEPQTPEEAARIAEDDALMPGKMRKVGPSLRHIESKSTAEFLAYWTEEPKKFRPDTRMPQFFHLTNQHDAMAEVLQPIELAAVAEFLIDKSEPFETLQPRDEYEPNVERGQDLFTKRGCLACHNKGGEEYEGIDEDFGPDLSRIHEKVLPGEAGFNWLYTWIKEPTRYHPRTKMPDLYLDPYEADGEYVDPAADIAAYLLQGEAREFPELATPQVYLGIVADEDFTEAKARRLGLSAEQFSGIRVTEVIQGSPATRTYRDPEAPRDLSPLRADDVVTAINGEAVTSPEKLAELEQALQPEERVTLAVIRGGRELTLETTASTPLDDLVRLYLSKSLSTARMEQALERKQFPVTEEMYAEEADLREFIKGDEIELAPREFGEEISDEEWERRKRLYVGRRTVSQYGCYGCHDISGYEEARPIGTALQDWGRKDTSQIAFEHIHEFLHHHGEPDGSSTADRLERAVKNAQAGIDVSEQELTEALLYESVISHGRAGFLWQKLRQPRSFDYRKTETQGWDERLKMPKFPFSPDEIEAVATFVLGLVAEPPKPEYKYRPDGVAGALIEGERILQKYNCASCHVMDMPEWEFGIDPDFLIAHQPHEDERPALDLLHQLKPPREAWTGETLESGEPILRATGYPQAFPDPEEDPEFQLYSFVLWDALKLEDDQMLMPGQPLPVAVPMIHSQSDGRGGELAQWMVPRLVNKAPGVTNINEAWQAAPPPLVGEGHKAQTPWLYQFLKEPEQLRYTTVLRMPKFNMDDEEALALANYFAARDRAAYPYQSIPQKRTEYKRREELRYQEEFPDAEYDFLTASWNVLNGPLCRKCHQVGGNVVTETDPREVKRGPNLQRTEQRLRPDWVQLWVYNPKWLLPYTSMPENFPAGQRSAMPELFGGSNRRQAEATIDALFNYMTLIEAHGETTYGEDIPDDELPGAESASTEDRPTDGAAETGGAQ
jgi:cbb3-type cytochrome oxidase cytochrome c subunit